jgi:putative transcriptional regulator
MSIGGEKMEKTLAELRKERGLSQRDLAKKLGVSYGAIALYETGKRTPSLKRAKEIADIFGVSVETILFGANVDETKASDLKESA